jgi:hypothetical protein
MKLDAKTVKQLERILERELSLYTQYLALLEQEQQFVVTLKADKVTALSARRGDIINSIDSLRQERTAIVETITGHEGVKLSECIENFCLPADSKKLLSLVTKIKLALEKVEYRSREFNNVLSFSLGLVNGEISLLWSASQSVNRVYNAFGSMHEAVQPGAPRAGSLLGEA